MAPNGHAAEITLGTYQTIASLFQAIEQAFEQENGSPPATLRTFKMAFTNLGPLSQRPQVLHASDDNQKLEDLRLKIFDSYNKYREDVDGEVIIAKCDALFESSGSPTLARLK